MIEIDIFNMLLLEVGQCTDSSVNLLSIFHRFHGKIYGYSKLQIPEKLQNTSKYAELT